MQTDGTSPFVEKTFEVFGLKIAAAYRQGEGRPMIALHGWLDNLASFEPLARQFESVDFLALDLAGHGKSSHRSADASYHIWDDIREILQIADQMGWQQFSLLGHSRGGIIASIIAACFPERVQALFLVEGFWPMTAKADNFPSQLRKSVIENAALKEDSKLPPARSLDALCHARSKSLPGVGADNVKALVERAVSKIEGGYCWSFDRRLKAASPVMLSDDQVAAMIAAIKCPVQLFVGSRSMAASMPSIEEKLSCFSKLDVTEISGGHHPHLESGVDEIAQTIQASLAALYS